VNTGNILYPSLVCRVVYLLQMIIDFWCLLYLAAFHTTLADFRKRKEKYFQNIAVGLK